MPIKHHVALDRARKAARKLSREGGTTHQQALDRIAREAGFRHWNDMASADPVAPAPLLLTGPSSATGPSVSTHSGFGPMKLFFELDQFEYLRAPATPDVAAWMPSRGDHASGEPPHPLRIPTSDVQTLAQAADPDGGPWPEGASHATTRCPVHDDRSGSLRISKTATGAVARCMAGCDDADVARAIGERIAGEARAAIAFMKANDRHKVIAGWGRGDDGVGGRGGVYRLRNDALHVLPALACRMLPPGYPDWYDGDLPRGIGALERALRMGLAGRRAISVHAPEDGRSGVWTFRIDRTDGGTALASRSGTGPVTVSIEGAAGTEIVEDAPAAATKHVMEMVGLAR